MLRDSQAHVQSYLASESKHSNVLLVQGARQVGKTFMIRNSLQQQPNTISINFEREPDVKLAIDSTKKFDEFVDLLTQRFAFKPHAGFTLFIDEAQESEKLGSYVRFMKEEWTLTKVILTGSSMTRLFPDDVRVPVGRVEYLHIQGFSFREFLRMHEVERYLDDAKSTKSITDELHQILLSWYDKYLHVGGLPDAVIAHKNGQDFESVLRFIVASQRDDFLRNENVKSYLFLDALKGVANHIGSAAKFTHVAGNNYDAKKILQKLQEWYLVSEIEQRGESPTQSFAPKRYLYDLGVLRMLRDNAIPKISLLHTLDERLRTPLGGLLENAVNIQISKGPPELGEIAGWKKNNKEPVEVDFVIKHHGVALPIEVKASLNVGERHCKNLFHYCKIFGTKRGVLLALDVKKSFSKDQVQIEVIPAYLAEELK